MKCIYCQNDCKYKEREDGSCPKCRHRFAFEPTKGDKLTDGAFKAAIDRVSALGKVKWNKEHLYYEVARKLRPGSRVGSIVCWVIGGIFVLAMLANPASVLVTVILWSLALAQTPKNEIALERSAFQDLWQRWVATHGQPPGLIVRTEAAREKRKKPLPGDIAHYSFDRAVITDRAETVDVLIANNFHFENNCAVLSIDGYPENAFDTVRAMLKKNPKLVVFALHDATVEGCTLAGRLSTSREWFASGARVVDVGLRPVHKHPFEGCWQKQSGPLLPDATLSHSERRWLERYYIELAVIRPEQIIKRLFRAISGELDAIADGQVYVDVNSFSADAGSSDGGGDSFG